MMCRYDNLCIFKTHVTTIVSPIIYGETLAHSLLPEFHFAKVSDFYLPLFEAAATILRALKYLRGECSAYMNDLKTRHFHIEIE